jgi:NADH:ubiquinone reductase (H+-translocating)
MVRVLVTWACIAVVHILGPLLAPRCLFICWTCDSPRCAGWSDASAAEEFVGEVPIVKHVVIVGGGFAGLNCARKLAASRDVRVTLIDRNNYQQFQPLLYQVATSALASADVAFNLRSVLREHANVDVKMSEVVSVDLKTRTVATTEGQRYQGDYLVLAAGSQPNFFGTPGADQYSYPMYSLRNAEALRSRILAVVEAADRDPSLVAKGALNFVIVGAGPTGVEMAGAFGDTTEALKSQKLTTYRDLPADQIRVFLVDHGTAVLAAFSDKAQSYAAKMLEQRGIQLCLSTSVKEVGSGHVLLSDGTKVLTHTVIWAGGLKASPLSANLGLQPGHGGRVDVQPDLTVKGFDGVYSLGDFANIAGKDGKPLPQLASVAEQSGKWCARNIHADIAGQPRQSFEYFDKGIMAMIGRNAAVAEVGAHRHELHGTIAFAAWLGVHAALLTTMRARIEAFVEWAWRYFSGVGTDPILDRSDQARINWNDDQAPASAPDLSSKVRNAS